MSHNSPHIPPEKFAQPSGNGHAGTAVAVAEARRERPSREESTDSGGALFRASRRVNSLMGVQILGCGSYVPDTVVTNEELEQQYGFEPGWISQRSGILQRRYASPDEATSQLCAAAARRAIANAGVNAADIDLLVVGTFTPDYLCPSTACLVQDQLGLDAPAVDLQAACSSFMYAMVTAAQYVATGNSKLALVCGGDTNSRIINPRDIGTAPLFGDGAGAVLLAKGSTEQGLVCYQMGSDGSGGPLLTTPAGGTALPITKSEIDRGNHYLQMDGRNVFKWAVKAVTETIRLMLDTSGMHVDDVACFVLHQANVRIIMKAASALGIRPERIFNNLQKYGNTSAGSIPIALDEALRDNRIQRGDTVLFSGFGAGLTWGTGLFRW